MGSKFLQAMMNLAPAGFEPDAKGEVVALRVGDGVFRRALLVGVSAHPVTCELTFVLQIEGGSVERLVLAEANARQMVPAFAHWLDHPGRLTRVHSDSSSGSPQSAVSTPEDGEMVCPPTRSSSAELGE